MHYLYRGLHSHIRHIDITKVRNVDFTNIIKLEMWTHPLKSISTHIWSYQCKYRDNYPEAVEYAMKESNKALQNDRYGIPIQEPF